jgi:protein-S-isoprenylcysteine O-methyltransferase Ste14
MYLKISLRITGLLLLSKREDSDMIKMFGDEYKRYMEMTPMFIPTFSERRR